MRSTKHIYLYILVYTNLCKERETDRERQRATEREGERERERLTEQGLAKGLHVVGLDAVLNVYDLHRQQTLKMIRGILIHVHIHTVCT
jgi:hypothetical protein